MAWIDLRQRSPWVRGGQVHVVAVDREPALRAALIADGFRCLTIDGRTAVDVGSFFAAAAAGLPFPSHFGANWDAFRDALSEIVAPDAAPVAVLWLGVDAFVRSDLGAFVAAVTAFDDVARGLASVVPADGGPLQLEVFLLSQGPGAV